MTIPTCHPEKQYGARGMCRVCYNRWLRNNNPRYRRKCRESARKLGQKADQVEKRAARVLKCRYGITPDERDQMRIDQGSLCKICNKNKSLIIEHCHKTGKVRGLVCQRCNLIVGIIETAGDCIPLAYEYLEDTSKQ